MDDDASRDAMTQRRAWWPDRRLGLVLSTRLLSVLAGPVTLYLVATRRSLSEQGFFFVLVNVQALTSLVELGAGTIVVQFISHESPSLRWRRDGALEGEYAAVARALEVVRQGWRWYGSLAALLLLALPLGIVSFGASAARSAVPFRTAWTVVIVATAAYLPLVPLLCTLEGAHGLLRVQAMRLVQSMIAILALWIGLVSVGALEAVSMFAVSWLLVPATWLVWRHRAFVAQALRVRGSARSLAATQWRTGGTWLVLWAAPQLLPQLVLAARGASDAGRIGMSLAIATAPVTLAGAWLQSRYPEYAATLARSGRTALDELARRAGVRALAVCALGGLAATSAAWLIHRFLPRLGDRLLSTGLVAALCATGLGWIAIHALAAYLRAERVEPLFAATALGVALTTTATALAAPRGAEVATLTYSLAVLAIALPIVTIAFRAERAKRIGAPRE
ncbi:MAG: hypothetical protein ACJ79A_12785 [Gemmatimonadaceae bacterium]